MAGPIPDPDAPAAPPAEPTPSVVSPADVQGSAVQIVSPEDVAGSNTVAPDDIALGPAETLQQQDMKWQAEADEGKIDPGGYEFYQRELQRRGGKTYSQHLWDQISKVPEALGKAYYEAADTAHEYLFNKLPQQIKELPATAAKARAEAGAIPPMPKEQMAQAQMDVLGGKAEELPGEAGVRGLVPLATGTAKLGSLLGDAASIAANAEMMPPGQIGQPSSILPLTLQTIKAVMAPSNIPASIHNELYNRPPGYYDEEVTPEAKRSYDERQAINSAVADMMTNKIAVASRKVAKATGEDPDALYYKTIEMIPGFVVPIPGAEFIGAERIAAGISRMARVGIPVAKEAAKLGVGVGIGAIAGAGVAHAAEALGLGGGLLTTGAELGAAGGLLKGRTVVKKILNAVRGLDTAEVAKNTRLVLETPNGATAVERISAPIGQRIDDLDVQIRHLQTQPIDSAEQVKLKAVREDGSHVWSSDDLKGTAKDIRARQEEKADLEQKLETITKQSKFHMFTNYAASMGANMIAHTAVGAGIGGVMGAVAAPTGMGAEGFAQGSVFGASIGAAFSPFAARSGLRNLRLSRGRQALTEMGSNGFHLPSLEGVDPNEANKVLMANGFARSLGGEIKVVDPVKHADWPNAVPRGAPAGTAAMPANGYISPDGNTIYINKNAIGEGTAFHELRHMMQRFYGQKLRLKAPEIMEPFEEAYAAASGDPNFNVQAEMDAEIGRIAMSSSPIEAFYGGEQAGDVTSRIARGIVNHFVGDKVKYDPTLKAPYTPKDIETIKQQMFTMGRRAQAFRFVEPVMDSGAGAPPSGGGPATGRGGGGAPGGVPPPLPPTALTPPEQQVMQRVMSAGKQLNMGLGVTDVGNAIVMAKEAGVDINDSNVLKVLLNQVYGRDPLHGLTPAAAPPPVPGAPAAAAVAHPDYGAIRTQAEEAAGAKLPGKSKERDAKIAKAGLEAAAQEHAKTVGPDTDLITWRTNKYGESSIWGTRADPNDPFHQMLIERSGLNKPEMAQARTNLNDMESNIGRTVAVDYTHAPEEGVGRGEREAARAVSGAPERVAGAAAQEKSTKSFVPINIRYSPKSNVFIVDGFSPDKFLTNAGTVIKWANENGMTTYGGINDPLLVQHVQQLTENHQNGFDARGRPIKGTPLTPVTQTTGYKPHVIPKEFADQVNVMMGNVTARTGKKGLSPEQAEKQALARQNYFIEPSTGETNKLRLRMGAEAEKLSPVNEALRPELIDGVRQAPVEDVQTVRPTGFTGDRGQFGLRGLPKSEFVAAGLMPHTEGGGKYWRPTQAEIEEGRGLGGMGSSGMWDTLQTSGHAAELARDLGVDPAKRFYEQKPEARQKITEHFRRFEGAQYMPGTTKTPPELDADIARNADEGHNVVESTPESETIELGMNKQQMMALVGPQMYDKPIQEVTAKELLQNAFDASRSSGATMENPLRIDINTDPTTRTISVTDKGAGMNKDIIKSAFFTVGGTFKTTDPSNTSGGLGLAKMAFMLGSDRVRLETVKDGFKHTVDATSDQIRNGTFKIDTAKSNEPNGTSVTVQIPESYVDSNGETKPIYFSEKPAFLEKPLLGPVEVALNGEMLPLGVHQTGWQPDNVFNFSWGKIDVYVDPKKVKYPRFQVQSAGLHQFELGDYEIYGFNEDNKMPYHFVLDVRPNVKTDNAAYPFNNQREGFRGTIKDDIEAMKKYFQKQALEQQLLEAKDVFGGLKQMAEIDPTKNLTQEQLDRINAQYAASQRRAADLPVRKVKSVDFGKKTVTIHYEDGGQKKQSRQKYVEESFKAERDVDIEATGMDVGQLNPEKPLLHNNTNVDFSDIADAPELNTKLGNALVKFMREFGEKVADDYEDLGRTDAGGWFGGISYDKEYRGLNMRKPFKSIWFNPGNLSHDAMTSPEAAASETLHIFIHEITHVEAHSEGPRFTSELATNYARLRAQEVPVEKFETALSNIYAEHWDAINDINTKFQDYNTKNRAASFKSAAALGPERGPIKGIGEGAPPVDVSGDVGVPEQGRGGAGGAAAPDPTAGPIGEILQGQTAAPEAEPTVAAEPTTRETPSREEIGTRAAQPALRGISPEGSQLMPATATAPEGGFYTKSGKAIEEKMAKAADSDQVKALLRNAGIGKNEMEWLGLNDLPKGKMTKEEVQQWITAHTPEVAQTVLGGVGSQKPPSPELQNFISDVWHGQTPTTPEQWRGMEQRLENLASIRGNERIYGDLAREARYYSRGLQATGSPAQYGGGNLNLPGGENYREFLYHLPARENTKAVQVAFDRLQQVRAEYRKAQTANTEAGVKVVELMNEAIEARNAGDPLRYGKLSDEAEAAAREQTELYRQLDNLQTMRTMMERNHARAVDANVDFRSGHFGGHGLNLMAHMRADDRITAEGNKMLFSQEYQSDWAHGIRSRGVSKPIEIEWVKRPDGSYHSVGLHEAGGGFIIEPHDDKFLVRGSYDGRSSAQGVLFDTVEEAQQSVKDEMPENLRGAGVTDMPFKGEAWKKYVLRQQIRQAVEEGKDSIGWTTGSQQNRRYNLSKVVSNIDWNKGLHWATSEGIAREIEVYTHDRGLNSPELYIAVDKDGKILEGTNSLAGSIVNKHLSDVLGKGISDQILSQEKGTLEGKGLDLGGEGKKNLYDKQFVQIANDIGKKFGAKVQDAEIPVGQQTKITFRPEDNGTYTMFQDGDVMIEDVATLREAVQLQEEMQRELSVQVDNEVVHELPITPQMRESVQTQGQPMFMPHTQTETPEFKRWFGESKVADESGKPLVVYHGTTHDFRAFDPERAQLENDWGKGSYFSNAPEDIAANYAGMGPDLTGRVERRAEQIHDEARNLLPEHVMDRFGVNIREADLIKSKPKYDTPEYVERRDLYRRLAKKEIAGAHGGATMPVYLKMENPLELGGKKEPHWSLDYDEETGEESGDLVKLHSALQEATFGFDEADGQKAFSEAIEKVGPEGKASDYIDALRHSDGLQYATDEKGELAGTEILRQMVENMGYDGVIDRLVNKKFGSERRVGQQMEGVTPDTAHYIAFEPTQVKSAIGNRGTFDPNEPDIALMPATAHATLSDPMKTLDLSKDESFHAVNQVVPVKGSTTDEHTMVDTSGERYVGHFDPSIKVEPGLELMPATIVGGQKELTGATEEYYIPSKILGAGQDPKTIKGEKYGYTTYIAYMAAHDKSGVINVCKFAVGPCIKGCLGNSGQGALPVGMKGRINKARFFHYDPATYLAKLDREITNAKGNLKKGMTLAIRLNGTSDLPWEKIRFGEDQKTIMERHPNVQFYDYTKYPDILRDLPDNYHLTYSYTGEPVSDKRSQAWLDKHGVNTAVVFRDGMPAEFLGRPVVDGDTSDLRFLDPKGVVVGLHAKGKLRLKHQKGPLKGQYIEQGEFVYDTPPEDVAIPYVTPVKKGVMKRKFGEKKLEVELGKMKDAAPKAGDLKWKRGNPLLDPQKPIKGFQAGGIVLPARRSLVGLGSNRTRLRGITNGG